ncbi:MAG: Transcriptional regulator, TrmB [Parcubacteria group bacterium GW2011_GWE2_38_18]|nr:MAG: Transcriptional regulator, TrmB [Parcubacteria group bacterium GW2011_GWE2_38_18]
MELEKILQLLGLNEKEAKVYLALMQLGTATVPSISKRAGTKRPTTYLILEDLRKRGLVTPMPRGITTIFTAESPEKILESENEKKKIIEASLPDLLAIYNTKKEKPKVRFYEGTRGVEEVYAEIMKEKEIFMYGSIATIEGEIPGIAKKNIENSRKNKSVIKEFLQNDSVSQKYKKEFYTPGIHEIKIAPKKYSFPTDNMIYGNKIAFFSYKDGPKVVVIESSDVVATYKSMFDIIWNAI